MTAQCINLKARFGDRFVVDYEESYYAERTKRTIEDPWLMIIPCRSGHIFPWGGERLAFSVDAGHIQLAGIIRRLSCCRIEQDGDDGETNASFHIDDFEAVAKVVHPKRRLTRVMTPEQRERFKEVTRKGLEGLRKYREQLAKGERIAPESPAEVQEVF